MTRKLSRTLGLCALLLAPRSLAAQNGPDNDADAAPGYTNSVFHHEEIDSINLYNGQLTLPIALGPSYPIGPKLRLQLSLVYNSRVDDFGAPKAGQTPPPQQSFAYRPLVGNSSLGIGWELSLGAIKNCRHGISIGQCYVAPDGSQHMFNRTHGNGKVTGDGSQFYLKGTGPYEMWDGHGNRYFFDKQVSGFDDLETDGYTHDFGRGRDGWYLGSLTDPHGNGYTVTYWTGSHPQWTYGASTCSPAITAWMKMRPPAGTGGWVPKEITLPSGQVVRIQRGFNGYLDGMVTAIDFPVFVNGSLTTRTWTLAYDAPYASYPHSCAVGAVNVNLQRLKEIRFPLGPDGRSEVPVRAGEPSDEGDSPDGRKRRVLLRRIRVLSRTRRRPSAGLRGPPAALGGRTRRCRPTPSTAPGASPKNPTRSPRPPNAPRTTKPAGWIRCGEC